MAKYETMMVTTANLDEEASNALINKFKNLIAANGTIDSVDDWLSLIHISEPTRH